MAGFQKSVLTDVGRSALMRILTDNGELTFTRIALGDGQLDPLLSTDELAAEERSRTALISERASIPITEKRLSTPEVATIGGVFNNVELEEGFALAEIGVYVSDDDGGEILYAYTNAQDGTRWLSGYNGSVAYQELFRINAYIGDAQDVTFSAPSDAYVTVGAYEDLEAKLQESNVNLTAKVESLTAALKELQRCHIDDLEAELEITNSGTAAGSIFQPGDPVEVSGLVTNPTKYPAHVACSIITGCGVLVSRTVLDIDPEDTREISGTHTCTEEDLAEGLSVRAVLEVSSDPSTADVTEYRDPLVIDLSGDFDQVFRLGEVITGVITLTNTTNQDFSDLTLTVLPPEVEVADA